MTGFIILLVVAAVITVGICVGTYIFEKAPVEDKIFSEPDEWDRYHNSSQWGR